METPKLTLLRNAMHAYSLRNQALASNIANLDTPGYRRLAVKFEDELQDRIHQVPSLRNPEDVKPEVETQDSPPLLEDELMELADTQMRNQLTARALTGYFESLRTGIVGRNG